MAVEVPIAFAIMYARTDVDYTLAVRQSRGAAIEYANLVSDMTRIVPLWTESQINTMNDRITFRLGPLAVPMAAYCEKHGTTPSEAIRLALSRLLRVEAPEMPPGNPAIGEQAEAGAAARWKPKRKRRK